MEAPIGPASVEITQDSIDSVDLAAEIGLRGRAGLKFRVNLSAGFDLAGFNLWRQTWNLLNFDAGVAWKGGFKYSPNPGPHWDMGKLGVDLEETDDETLDETEYRDTAEVDEEDIVEAILNENKAQVAAPDGTDEDHALPFDWYKPISLYPATIDLPNADDPKEVNRDDGPTTVRYTQ
jgi:hypothetical protein